MLETPWYQFVQQITACHYSAGASITIPSISRDSFLFSVLRSALCHLQTLYFREVCPGFDLAAVCSLEYICAGKQPTWCRHHSLSIHNTNKYLICHFDNNIKSAVFIFCVLFHQTHILNDLDFQHRLTFSLFLHFRSKLNIFAFSDFR